MISTAEVDALVPELVALRRTLHANPELGLHLPLTRAAVLEALKPLELELTLSESSSAITAVVRGARRGPAVLLRADMDALPIVEQTGLDYAATGEAMHACGHDMHAAALVGAARLLHARREELAGSVVLMFQPAEELGIGAKLMIDEGVLSAADEPIEAAYAIHVVPGKRGVFSTRGGTIMAGSMSLHVTLRGRGGHASAPHLTVDPVPALTALVRDLDVFQTRRFNSFEPIVLTVTQLAAGGEAVNVIGDTARLGATIRVLSAASQDRVLEELPVLIESVARAHGCSVEIDLSVQTPPTVNDAALAERARRTLALRYGAERVWTSPAPVMGSEDFAYVLERVPGVLLFLRATPADVDLETVAPNHTAHVVFDDSVLGEQAAALAELALSHVGGQRD